MILGIGTDIVEVNRIAKAIAHWGNHFLEHVFTQEEINYCLRFKNPNPHFAGRFAAKEAVIKALPNIQGLSWTDIEILNESTGKPHCAVSGLNTIFSINISISHTKSHAIAFSIITPK